MPVYSVAKHSTIRIVQKHGTVHGSNKETAKNLLYRIGQNRADVDYRSIQTSVNIEAEAIDDTTSQQNKSE